MFMREADRVEVRASHGHSPVEALLRGVEVSDMVETVVDEDGTPFAILGVAPRCRLTGNGAPWLLGTDDVVKNRRAMVQDAGPVLDRMMNLYPSLENYVHCDNRISVRWLKSIGFKFDEPVVIPYSGEKFMRFHMKKEH
jgi:hypothetical protein